MKKFLLSAFALGLCSTAHAAKFDSIYLSDEIQECVNSMDLQFSMWTERIKDDEILGEKSYFINPFRNIDQSIAMLDRTPVCFEKYVSFTNKALKELNETGRMRVYGISPRVMRYFTSFDALYYVNE